MTTNASNSSVSSHSLNILGNWSLKPRRHCLDLRATELYAQAHLTPSTSIPITTLEQRFSQLPPRSSNTTFLLITEPNAYFHGVPVSEHLRGRGWKFDGVIEIPDTADSFWNFARELKVFGTDSQGKELLFRPSPILEAWITWIEDSLSTGGRNEARALDIGCGSGRDLGFLANRPFKWKVTGLDNWKKALERAEIMVHSLNADSLEEMIHAEIDEVSGKMTPINSQEMEDRLGGSFDLLIIVRFFPKALFQNVAKFLRHGGYLLFSHFTTPLEGKNYDTPPQEKRVRPGEVERMLLDGSPNWHILQAQYSESEDGRRLWDVVARYHEIQL
jgi:SAM-dependent methyltransferase